MRHRVAALLLVLIAWSAAPAVVRAAAPLPRDVVVTDVGPGGFTVTWTAEPGTGTLQLFADVMGTVPAQGLTLETGPRLGGDPAASAALGVYRVRVGGLARTRPLFFRTVTTPLAGGAPLLEPAAGKALPSAVTSFTRFARTANGLGATVTQSGPGMPVPGALVRVRVVGSGVPLAALTGDGYDGALGAVDLANLQTPDGSTLLVTGGESTVVEALAGTLGRARLTVPLDANAGFGALQQVALAVAPVPDSDGDGMPNDWETEHGLDPNAAGDATSDDDDDDLPALQEYRLGTDPENADTDRDLLNDGAEVARGTIPTIADTDRDDYGDGQELDIYGTNPLDADSDDDGYVDGIDPSPNDGSVVPLLDTDGDGVQDPDDVCPTVADPAQTDTDGDGLGDACDPDDDDDGVSDGGDVCPRLAGDGGLDGDGDGLGDACDNCPALASDDLTNTDGDALDDVCDPDDDNDFVPDFDPPAASNLPFVFTGATAIVDTSLPAVAASNAFVGISKRLPGDLRIVTLGFFDLKNRTFLPGPALSPADAAAPGWLAVQVDTNDCDCFTLAGTETITIATDEGNVTALLPLGAETLGRVIFVSEDGSTFDATSVAQGILVTLLRSSQPALPRDNCRLVFNPSQADADLDGIGDACDGSTGTTTITPTSTSTSTTRVPVPTTTTTLPDGKSLFLFVSDSGTEFSSKHALLRYDGVTGAARGAAGAPADALLVPSTRPGSGFFFMTRLAGGARNDVYGMAGAVFRWDATTGANFGVQGNPLSAVIPWPPSTTPSDLQFGPDGLLWVMSANQQHIIRMHPETGKLVSTFVQYPQSGNPDSLSTFLVTPDGVVYVARGSNERAEVLRYDAATGAPRPGPGQVGARFVVPGFFKLGASLAIGPEGDLYVADATNQDIRAFDGSTGAPRGVFVGSNLATNGGLRSPSAIAFGPDGHLYVASSGSGAVLRYHGFTGAFLSTFVAKGQGGLVLPRGLVFLVADTPAALPTTTSTVPATSTSTTTSTVVTTTTTSTTLPPLCGNGTLDDGEACDGALGTCGAGSACGAPGGAGACLCVAAGAQTLLVNSTLDTADASPGDGVCETAAGNGVCTLRAAVAEANALAGPNLIQLPAGRHPGVWQGAFAPEGLVVTGDLMVRGAGAASTVIDGLDLSRILLVQPGVVVTLRDLMLTRGRGAGQATEHAGAIANRGTVTLVDVAIRDNRAGESAGLRNATGATLTMVRTEVVFNRSGGFGGAALTNFGTATIRDSFLHHNVGATISTAASGAVLRVERTTIWRNRGDVSSTTRAAIVHDFNTTTTVVGSTISENIGAGISGNGNVTIVGSTIYANRAYGPSGPGGGIYAGTNGTTRIRNSIVAGNESYGFTADCSASGTAFVSEGYNLIERPTCQIAGDLTGNVTGQAPLLGPLVQQGGRTPTHALLPGSPARNAGNPSAPGAGTACETIDQRGVGRPQSARCDIGAFEDDGAPAGTLPPALHFVVQDTGSGRDAVPGDGLCAAASGTCTLPAAIDEANRHRAAAVVHLPAATFTFGAAPYDDVFEGASALPQVFGDLTLRGQGAASTILEVAPGASFRLLLAFSDRLSLERLSVRGGGTTSVAGQAARMIRGRLELHDAAVRDMPTGRFSQPLAVHSGTAVLRRVTLSGNSSGGGALEVWYGNVDIEDLFAAGNVNAFGAPGAAVRVLAVEASRVVRATFSCNNAQIGAALEYRTSGPSERLAPTLLVEDSTFESNLGGALNTPEPAAVEIRRSRFIGNQTDGNGAAITSGGPLLVRDSDFVANSGAGGGGAILLSFNRATRRIVDSTFTCNRTNGNGGAIEVQFGVEGRELELERTTFAGNVSYFGSGGALSMIGNGIDARVVNSSFTDNVAALDGGAVHLSGSVLELASVTVGRNVAGRAGGGLSSFGGDYQLRNTLVAGNADGGGASACSTGLRTFGNNLLDTTRGCFVTQGTTGIPGAAPGDLLGPVSGSPIDARVAPADLTCPVVDMGSCTQVDLSGLPESVCALAPDSPAVDAGNAGGCSDLAGGVLATDSRGVARADDDGNGSVRCEIGACEGTDGIIPTTTTSTSTTSTTLFRFPVTPPPTFDDPLPVTTTLPGQSTTTITTTTTTSTTSTSASSTTTTSSTTATSTSATPITSSTSSSTTTTTSTITSTSTSVTTTSTTSTDTTSTVTSTSTTVTTPTTVPGPCDLPRAPTYESIDCRLDELIAIVQASNDLGKTKRNLERMASKARDLKIKSETLFYADGPRRKVKSLLHKASRRMVSFNFRVRSLAGRNQIGAETAVVLRGLGEPILEDMRTLLDELKRMPGGERSASPKR